MNELIAFLFEALLAFVKRQRFGEVFFSRNGKLNCRRKIRLPDIVFHAFAKHAERSKENYELAPNWSWKLSAKGADDRKRDLVEKKRREYAKAGIAEYWIIDPQLQANHGSVAARWKDVQVVHGEFEKASKREFGVC